MNVLIVEDEPRLATLIARTLEREGFNATVAGDGQTGLDEARFGEYDVIVLDRMLPALDGMDVLRELRAHRIQTPVLFLTALGDVPERIEGLRAGADDYLGKPFSFDELVARVLALTRRARKPLVDERQTIGDLEIDLARRTVSRNGEAIELSPREFALLATLLRHRGQVLSRDQLMRRVWGPSTDTSEQSVDLYIHYLRKKLDHGSPESRSLIRTVRGFGYSIG